MAPIGTRLGRLLSRRRAGDGGGPPPATSHVVAPPTVSWPSDGRDPLLRMTCPNCGSDTAKPLLLTVSFATPDHPPRHSRVLRCPGCGCAFYDDQTPPDYAEGAMLGRGRMELYLQQGAGISLITRPLALLNAPPGSRYLDVGCGFGFGLDFARRARGWDGLGIDPGQIAGLGRDRLGIPIELRYLTDDEPELAGRFDIVMAAETLEHVRSPADFIATLRRALRPGGILVIATPDGADLTPATPPAALVPLLSPGLHLVFQTATSLEALLRRAGFAHLRVGKDGGSLLACASDRPITLEQDEAAARRRYLDYLEQRAGDFPPDGDLFLCFAARAYQEAGNDGDRARTDRMHGALHAACAERFGFDLDSLSALPEGAATAPLERLTAIMPLALGGILYTDAIRRLSGGAPRAGLEARFLLAAEAADTVRRATGELAMEDAMSESIAWTARGEAVLCAADAGAGDLADRLAALPAAMPSAARRALAGRIIGLLNSREDYAAAREVADRAGLWDAPPEATEARTVFALAVLDAQPGGDVARGRMRFAAVRQAAPADPDLYWSALRGEAHLARAQGDQAALDDLLDASVHPAPLPPDLRDMAYRHAMARVVALVNGGDLAAARRLAGRLDAAGWTDPDRPPETAAERDALFALAMLDAADGAAPDRAARRFATLRLALARGRPADAPWPDLYWSATRGEALAMQALERTEAVAALLDPATHDLAALPPALADLPARFAAIDLVRLVNAGDYGAAEIAARGIDVAALDSVPAARLADFERDALFALAVLDGRAGADGQAAAARRRFATVRAACRLVADTGGALPPLYWGAVRGELSVVSDADDAAGRDALFDPAKHPAALPPDLAEAAARHAAARTVQAVNAGAYDAARDWAARFDPDAALAMPDMPRTDVLFALAVLDARPGGDHCRARDRFAAIRAGLDRSADLYWSALRGEAAMRDDLGEFDALEALLDSAARGGVALPSDLAALRVSIPARRLAALVNAGEHAAAMPLAARLHAEGIGGGDPAAWPAHERDAVFAMAVLAARPGGDRRRAATLFRAARASLPAPSGPDAAAPSLYWSSLHGEVTALLELGEETQADRILAEADVSDARLPPALADLAERRACARLVQRVNAGRLVEAREMAARLDAAPFAHPPFTATAAHQRDALFALAVLDAAPDGDPDRAAARFAGLRAAILAAGPVTPLYWSALRGEADARQARGETATLDRLLDPAAHPAPWPDEIAVLARRHAAGRLVAEVNAGRYDAARALAARLPADAILAADPAHPDPHERDALFALAVLDAQPGGAADVARARFARVRASLRGAAPPLALYWSALRGELELLGETTDLAPARALLDPAAHPAPLPADLADGVDRHAAGRLVALVSAGRFSEARVFAEHVAASGWIPSDPGTWDTVRRDAAFSLAMLDLQPGGDPARAADRFASVRLGLTATGAAPPSDLFWSALRGEMIALGLAGRDATANALIEAETDRLGTAAATMPPDLRDRLRVPARIGGAGPRVPPA